MHYKMYAAAGTSVSIDIREDAEITGLVLTNSGSQASELSFGSTSTHNVNDVTASILTTLSGTDLSVSGLKIPVQAGERLYLHSIGGTGTGECAAMIYTSGSSARPAVRRR
jgi:hypothetical protein